MRGSGGTQGGISTFLIGFVLAASSLYFFFDSVRVTAGGQGLFSGMVHHSFRDTSFQTTSMGIIFVPFFIGVIILFYDAKQKIGWLLLYSGLGIIVIEMLSRIRFVMNMKSSHLLIFIALFAAGVGMMLRSYRDYSKSSSQPPTDKV